MFVVTLVFAGLQLAGAAAVFAIARKHREAGLAVGFVAALFAAFGPPAMLMFFSAAAFFQLIALALLGLVLVYTKVRPSVFAAVAFAATLVIIGLVGWSGQHSWQGLDERYPFDSLRARLAHETKTTRFATTAVSGVHMWETQVPEATLARLEQSENYQSWRWTWNSRAESLRIVHASYVEQFVTSPGFGVSRMLRPSPDLIEVGDQRNKRELPVDGRPYGDGSPQPGAEIVGPIGEPPITEAVVAQPLAQLHEDAWHDFLDPDGFGYFRDKEHVAGFVPHSFFQKPPRLSAGSSPPRWLTVRVELVSMLKHEQPMVYVSKNLPNMNELRDAPVRERDAFEQRALTSLIEGEDLVSDVQPGRIRALGSLRAMRQCLQCHEVERGTLLVAFSYEFLRDSPPPKKADPDDDDLAALKTESFYLR